MKVAYITHYDSLDVRHWSGLGYYIARSLEKQGIEVIRINCSVKFTWGQRIRRRWTKLVRHRIRQIEREPAHLKRVASCIEQQLYDREYDLIFSPGSLPISFLSTRKPLVFFTDATYDCLVTQYDPHRSIVRASRLHGHQAEWRSIRKASLIIYTSAWAAQNAVSVYDADPDKILSLYFGPNLPVCIPPGAIEQTLLVRRARQTKTFLFMGVDWYRKGAGIAVEVVHQLNELGIPSRLIIAGCPVPEGIDLPDFVSYYPFISKSDEGGITLLQKLFKQADFFLLPTQADCTPVVFSEAASYGLPIITTNVGGCTSVVLNGITGFCIPKESFLKDAVEKIRWLCQDLQRYECFCADAYEHYERTLNWDVTGRKLAAALLQLLDTRTSLTVVTNPSS